MIKLNEQYSINNGQGTIVFTEGNKGTINALYNIKGNKAEGKINGMLDGNLLKGTFHVDAAAGLIEFTFTEEGFESKWKQGIEPGPMRGKWKGQFGIISNQENNFNSVLTDEQKQYLVEGITLEDFDEEYQGTDDGKVEWMKDKAFLLAAVKHDFCILKYASAELKADRELVLEAIKQDVAAIDYADEKLQCDPEILIFRIVTFFKGDNNISITEDDLSVFVNQSQYFDPIAAIEKLVYKVEFLLLKNKKAEFKVFSEKVIDFVNTNHECFWILQAILKTISKTSTNIDNYIYFNDKSKVSKYYDEVSELINSFETTLNFSPSIDFETYFNDAEIKTSWDDCKWTSSEDSEGLPFSEFIMDITGMEWDTESWSDVKFYNYAISSVWIGLQNYSLKQTRQGYDSEQVAVLFHSIIVEKYEPIQDSGNGHFGSFVFEIIVEFLIGISKNNYNCDETDRDDLESFDGIIYDLIKVGEESDCDLFDDWPGASEFEK
jgi:hypothetical protein